jgi:rare lipoprotein A
MLVTRRSLFVALAIASTLPSFTSLAAAQTGRASWYSGSGRTASGERCNPQALTAAHRSLPFGTRVQVHNVKNGRSVTVRINDRGPFYGGRIIDVSKAAAGRLGLLGTGTAVVRLTVVASR